ncbi:hypothetical protein FUA48_10680 [Flavobacterium alkalisoli]|uniref:PH domain-containing protein n=1 Tax=Flavobacterium alkalisoli TaxID=2602769 RepID=A0A5B9FW86_9FLAO|nr:hypothetical protein [Flavobacterium alkalisoli]QEE50028.1 hypothetical protein FUA48_10680 [Flavobacterium alkalisoli]
MKKISSDAPILLAKRIPYLILVFIVIAILFKIFDEFKTRDLLSYLLLGGMLFIAWLNLRTLKVVYADKNRFVVNGQEIFFKDVLSIRKSILSRKIYVVEYNEGNEVKKFRFSVNSFMSFTPGFIKDIKIQIKEQQDKLREEQ